MKTILPPVPVVGAGNDGKRQEAFDPGDSPPSVLNAWGWAVEPNLLALPVAGYLLADSSR